MLDQVLSTLHRLDALVTAEILLKLIPLLEAQGIHTLEEALSASFKSPFVKIKY